MKKYSTLVIIALQAALLFTIVFTAHGADGDSLWPYDGAPVSSDFSSGYEAVSDGNGGTLVFFRRSNDLHGEHIGPSGSLSWSASTNGVLIETNVDGFGVAPDGAGGAIVASLKSNKIYVQRVNASGIVQWGPGAVLIANSADMVDVTPDGSGGAYIAWRVEFHSGGQPRAAHVSNSGVLTSPGVDGIYLGTDAKAGGIACSSDGTGGAIVTWLYYPGAGGNIDVRAQKVTRTPGLSLPWGSTPKYVTLDSALPQMPVIAPDGQGGALLAFYTLDLVASDWEVRVQRLNGAGTRLWGNDGTTVVDESVVGGQWIYWNTLHQLDVTDDGAAGAIVAWTDFRHNVPSDPGDYDIYAQRVNAAGTTEWTANGVLTPPYQVGSEAPGTQTDPRIVSDLAGGAIVTCEDRGRWSDDISATRLSPAGAIIWGRWTFSDSVSQQDPGENQTNPLIVYDATGPAPRGAVIVWTDKRDFEIYAQKVQVGTGGSTTLPNDLCSGALPVGLGQTFGTLVGATTDGSSSCGGTNDVWFTYTATALGTLKVTTCGTHDTGSVDAGIDTVLSVHSGCPGTTGNQLACNDDWTIGNYTNACTGSDTGAIRDSALTLPLAASQTVLIRVARFQTSSDGPFVLNVEFECSDDPYELNNELGTAYDLSTAEGVPLSVQSGLAVMNDDDWYRIETVPGDNQVTVTCLFTHAQGDIDVVLTDANGVNLGGSTGTTDNEIFSAATPGPGYYYLRVNLYDGPGCSQYDLEWHNQGCLDDFYEENDSLATAFDISLADGYWLSDVWGPGTAQSGDWDYYQVSVSEAVTQLSVTCAFAHAEGDVDIYLLDTNGTTLASSVSVDDSEDFSWDVTAPGDYYILALVVGSPGCTSYDLRWDRVCPDDPYEENDSLATPYDLTDFEESWLSWFGGHGTAQDEDWYRIRTVNSDHLAITCTFSAATADLDLELYTTNGVYVSGAYGVTDTEIIDVSVPWPDEYLVRVYRDSGDRCNTYDLIWDNVCDVDDSYEDNDIQALAFDLAPSSNQWVSGYMGMAVMDDDDWYRVQVGLGQNRLVVTCAFTHAEGDIDLLLYTADGTYLDDAGSITDDEVLEVDVPGPGEYLLLVRLYSGFDCSLYDLWWGVDGCHDDPYEANDTIGMATDISGQEQTWLSGHLGLGVMQNQDWHRIEVSPSFQTVVATCLFTHVLGDIDLYLYDAATNQIGSSFSTDDNEGFVVNVALPGPYYLLVHPFGGAKCNQYDLRWDDTVPWLSPANGHVAVSKSNGDIELMLTDLTIGATVRVWRCTDLQVEDWVEADVFVAFAASIPWSELINPAWGDTVFYKLECSSP